MPTLGLNRDQLFKLLGETYTEEEFAELCFDFGLELDDVTSEAEEKAKQLGQAVDKSFSTDTIYKIDIPANRYDLLCMEGMVTALRVFLGKDRNPVFKTIPPKLTIEATQQVRDVRQFVVGAVLRNITFTEESYASFIDYQEKLHQNICRARRLVSIGTHDLDTISAPFTYTAKNPEAITFAPLGLPGEEMDANALFKRIETDPNRSHLKPYLPIIKNEPNYPVIYDSNGIVLSLPPIINGDHSKITMNTRNVLIEITATDFTKVNIVLNIFCAAFSMHCANKLEIEQVTIKYPDGTEHITPDMSAREQIVSVDYINSYLGLKLPADEVLKLLKKMMLDGNVDGSNVVLQVPPTRSDVLHPVDVVEDVGIAFGYNDLNIAPPPTNCPGASNGLNKLTDIVRAELAQAGYFECLTMGLCSFKQNYDFLRRKNDNSAVVVSNPCTMDFQICRTSILVGLLQSLHSNIAEPLPIRLFEVSDVVLLDEKSGTGAKNERRIGALYCSARRSGFELIHGLVDRIMNVLDVPYGKKLEGGKVSYYYEANSDVSYLDKRCAAIMLSNGKKVGTFGVLHPEVLASYQIGYPTSGLEMNLEYFL